MFDFSGKNSSYDCQWVNTQTCKSERLVFGFLYWCWKINLRWQRSLQLLSLPTLVTTVSSKSEPKTQQRTNEVTYFDCAATFSHKSYFCCRNMSTWKRWWMKNYTYQSYVSTPPLFCSIFLCTLLGWTRITQHTMTVPFGQP
jgi:hypothetical protein